MTLGISVMWMGIGPGIEGLNMWTVIVVLMLGIVKVIQSQRWTDSGLIHDVYVCAYVGVDTYVCA